MSNNYTKFTVSPAIPAHLMCSLIGHLLMADLGVHQDPNDQSIFLYCEDNTNGTVTVDDDLIALVESEPAGLVKDAFKDDDLENLLDEDLILDERGLDFVTLLTALSAANPTELPRIEVQGCWTGDRSRPGEHGGFAHLITPQGVVSVDTNQWLATAAVTT